MLRSRGTVRQLAGPGCVRVGRLHDDYGGDGVLENQLLLVIGFEDQRVLIEALDAARKLYAAEQIQRNSSFVLARIVEKAVLDILRRFVHSVSHITVGKEPQIRAVRLTIVHPNGPRYTRTLCDSAGCNCLSKLGFWRAGCAATWIAEPRRTGQFLALRVEI